MSEFNTYNLEPSTELDKISELERQIVTTYPKKKKDRYEARKIATDYARATLAFAEKNPGIIQEINTKTNTTTDYQLNDIEKWKTAIDASNNNKWNMMKKALKDTSKNLSTEDDPETKKISKAINNLAKSI